MNKSWGKYRLTGLIAVLIFWVTSMELTAKEDHFSSKAKVVLREIGNQLLLSIDDSSSVINPILEIEPCKFQMSFKRSLSIEPGDLVDFSKEILLKSNIAESYFIEVIQCEGKEIAYSFEIKGEIEKDIIPCRGRGLEEACYTIEITFTEKSEFNSTILYGLPILLGFLFVFLLKKKKTSQAALESETEEEDFSTFGSFQFYPDQNKLVKQSAEIGLSRKECELLEILVANLNQVVKRDELSKKVWEDNGVIVGRSLDTYISKLRKKLKDDETVSLTNIHGVGYKLEIKKDLD